MTKGVKHVQTGARTHGGKVDPGGNSLAEGTIGVDAIAASAAVGLDHAVEALHLLLSRHHLAQAQHAGIQRGLDAAVGLDRAQLCPCHLFSLCQSHTHVSHSAPKCCFCMVSAKQAKGWCTNTGTPLSTDKLR